GGEGEGGGGGEGVAGGEGRGGEPADAQQRGGRREAAVQHAVPRREERFQPGDVAVGPVVQVCAAHQPGGRRQEEPVVQGGGERAPGRARCRGGDGHRGDDLPPPARPS